MLVTGVAGDKNALGYFGFAYYEENQDKIKAVAIDSGGGCVEPSDATSTTAVQAADPAAVHLPVGKALKRPGPRGLRRLLPRQCQHVVDEAGYVEARPMF